MTASTAGTPARQPLRAVVVDDSEIVRHVLTKYLQAGGHVKVVGVASDGATAVDCVERCKPDLVLMDLDMPGMNGVDATRRIKQLTPPPRVIVVSLAAPPFVQAAMEAGADACCDKSTVPDALRLRIRELFPERTDLWAAFLAPPR